MPLICIQYGKRNYQKFCVFYLVNRNANQLESNADSVMQIAIMSGVNAVQNSSNGRSERKG